VQASALVRPIEFATAIIFPDFYGFVNVLTRPYPLSILSFLSFFFPSPPSSFLRSRPVRHSYRLSGALQAAPVEFGAEPQLKSDILVSPFY